MTMPAATTPAPSALLELLKPIAWFAPMWSFACGVVSSGATLGGQRPVKAADAILAGPLVCTTSQSMNDGYDRHVDALLTAFALRPIVQGSP